MGHHSVSVAGVVVDDGGKILVIRRRDNGHWEPPGGVLEPDETLDEGVRREVHEETGVRVVVDRLTGVYQNMVLGVVALVFRCSPESGRATATEESSDVAWMSLDEVRDAMTPAYAVRVIDAVEGHAVHSRSHDGVDLLDGDFTPRA